MNKRSDLCAEFERLWNNGDLPDLESFISHERNITAALLSRLARIDQAQRWERGLPCTAEQYFDRFPALCADADSALDFIYHEFLLREKHAEQPSLDEFRIRFPDYASLLARQVDFHRALSLSLGMTNGMAHVLPVKASVVASDTCGDSDNARPASSNLLGQHHKLGRYELLEVVGTGSFGTVYKAHDPELDRVVAIKIPRNVNLVSKGDADRFLREARSVAQLRHPGIISVHEIGYCDHTPYLVSEFVEGDTLASLLSSQPLPPREAAQLVATVADALHYAHEMGVIHRDVKLTNIMLDKNGTPRLMDFGLARRTYGDATMTLDGQLLGTPAYMSPEQARGESRNVDGRSDVYSLGVVLYHLLTAELPFRGTTPMLLHRLLHEEPTRPRRVNHSVPRDLDTICMRAMAKEAARRYATARDLADDLRRFLRDETIQARPVGGAERVWRWCRRNPALASLTLVVVILVIAIGLGGTAVVGLLLASMAVGSTLTAIQFRRQAQKEKRLRSEANENLYYHRIALAHRELTASPPHPGYAEELLHACPLDRRNWEWDYLKQLWRTEPVVLRSPGSGKFRGLAFSHDGSRLAAACGDGKIRVWDQKTGEIVVLPGHDGFVYSVAFSPADSDRLASSGNDGCVRLWDVKLKRETLPRPLPGLKVFAVGMAHSVAFSEDGRYLAAASKANTVQVWDASTAERVHQFEGHELQASCVAFSRDGQLLASGDWGGAVRIWDLETKNLIHKLQLPEHRWPVSCIAFSPDPSRPSLAAGYFNSRVDVWDTLSGKVHCELRGHSGFVTSVAFHPQDARRLVSAGEDRHLRIWDVPTGREVLQLQGHIDNCSGLAFRPDGRLLASASYDQTIRLWGATNPPGNQPLLVHTFDIGREIWSVAISPDGGLIAAAGEGTDVRLWDTNGREVRSFQAEFPMVVFSLAFSPDGRRVAATGFDGGAPPTVLKVLEISTGQRVLEHREGQEIFAIEFSPDGRWLAFGLADGSVKLADAVTGTVNAFVGKHDDPIAYGGVRFRRDGMRLASASLDGTVRIWDLTSALPGTSGEGESVVSSDVNRLRLRMSSGDPGIALWSVSYSPDGRHLITGDKDGQLRRWDAETGEELQKKCEASRGAFLSVAYSPNGRWIASASEDCAVRVYDGRTLELIHKFRGHLGPIRCLAAGKELVVTGGTDKTVKVWDLNAVEKYRVPSVPH